MSVWLFFTYDLEVGWDDDDLGGRYGFGGAF